MKYLYIKKIFIVFLLLIGLKAFAQTPPPTITSMSPNALCSYGGQTVTVYGSGFDKSVSVSFDQNLATITSIASDGSSLVMITPNTISYSMTLTKGTLSPLYFYNFTVIDLQPSLISKSNKSSYCEGVKDTFFADYYLLTDEGNTPINFPYLKNASIVPYANGFCFGFGKDSFNVYSNKIYLATSSDSPSEISGFKGKPRESAIMFSNNVNGIEYLFAGLGNDATTVFNDFYIYSSGTWRSLNYPGVARTEAVSFIIGNVAYVGLGKDANGNALNDFLEFDLINQKWLTSPSSLSSKISKRYSAYVFTLGTQVYIGGGTNGTNEFTDLYTISSTSLKFTNTGIVSPTLVNAVAMVDEASGVAYVGTGTQKGSPTDTIYKFTPKLKGWDSNTRNYIQGKVDGLLGGTFNGKMFLGMGNSHNMYSFKPYDSYEWYEYDLQKKQKTLIGDSSTIDYTIVANRNLSVITSLNGCKSNEVNSQFTINKLPTVVFSYDSTFNCLGDTLKVYANPNIQYQYNWTNSDSLTPIQNVGKYPNIVFYKPTSTVSNTYNLEVIDRLSCKNNYSLQIKPNALPKFFIASLPNDTICSGSSVTLTAKDTNSTKTTFAWNQKITNGVSFNPTSTLSYRVTATNEFNCKDTLSTKIVVNTLPAFSSMSVNPICSGDTAKFNAATNVKSKILWYADNNASTLIHKGNTYNIPKLSTEKTVFLVANDTITGCKSNIEALTAYVNPLPTFTVKGTNPTSCATATGSLVFSGLNTSTPYSYSYNNNIQFTSKTTDANGGFSVINLKSDSYAGFAVKDSKGCVGNFSSSINLVDPNSPVISLDTVTRTYCLEDSILLNATATPISSIISWNNNVKNNIKFKAPLKETIYVVTANNQECISTSSVRVKIKYDQIITFETIATNQDFAKGSLDLVATAKSELKVVFSASNESIVKIEGYKAIFLRNGTVTITASEGGNNCFNAANPISQTITISGKAAQTIDIPNTTNIIFGAPLINVPLFTSAELPITYTISDTNVVKIVNGKFIVLGNGNASITASNPGNTAYNAVEVKYVVTGLIPPFTILGKKYVKINTLEKYVVSPVYEGLKQTWAYTGEGVLFATNIENDSISVFFTDMATSGFLVCYVYSDSLKKSTPLEIKLPITVNRDRINELTNISCDQLTGHEEACSDSYLNDFEFNSIANINSGCNPPGYDDNTSSPYTSELYLGESYNAKITVGLNVPKNATTYVAIWIDYNNDGDFSDPDEFIISKNTEQDDLSILNIVIKSNFEYKGDRRMRVRTRTVGEFGREDWCIEANQKGETEDYKITLVIPDKLSAPVLITPNNDGKNDLFIIKGLKSENDIKSKLTVFNRAGDIVFEKSPYDNNWSGTDKSGKALVPDTYYYYFENDGSSLKGYFELRY